MQHLYPVYFFVLTTRNPPPPALPLHVRPQSRNEGCAERISRYFKGRAKGSGAVTSLPCFLVMMPKTSLVPLTHIMQPSRETRDTMGRQSRWQLYNSITMCDTPTSLTFTAGFSHIRRPQAARDAALNTNSRPGAPLAPYPSFTIDTNHC